MFRLIQQFAGAVLEMQLLVVLVDWWCAMPSRITVVFLNKI
jgi:hypothetical protein